MCDLIHMKRGSIIPHHMLLHNIYTSQLADADLGPAEDSSETRMLLRLSTILKKTNATTSTSGWWLNQPIWKIFVKMGSSSPRNRGENEKMLKTITKSMCFFLKLKDPQKEGWDSVIYAIKKTSEFSGKINK